MNFNQHALEIAMPLLMKGLKYTIVIVIVSIILAAVFSVVLTLMSVTRSKILRGITTVYVKIFRNIPFMIQVYLMYYAVPYFFHFRLPALQAGIVALGLYSAALYFNVIQMGIESLPKGQTEAAQALNIPYPTILGRIIFPQIIPLIIPPLINQMVTAIKESSVLSVITVTELTMMANDAVGMTYAPLEIFLIAAVFYWAINLIVETVGKTYAKRHTGYNRNLGV